MSPYSTQPVIGSRSAYSCHSPCRNSKTCSATSVQCLCKTMSTRRKSVPFRTMTKIIVPILIQFLLTYAEGQVPPSDERVQFEIREELPVGSPVGTVNTRPGLVYKLASESREFLLEPSTGEITTKVVIDRETLGSDSMDLLVQSVPSTNHLIEVRITILDVNDNSPSFGAPSILVSFSEADRPGRQIVLDTAMDRDIGANGIANNYTIVSGNSDSKFRLVLLTDTSRPLLYLENRVQLDREEQDLYHLNISAQDGGTPARYGFLQVNISITDFNDKPPLFDQSDYSAEINETTPVDTSIIQVRATDEDIGANADITYSIVSDDYNQFAVDPRTGVVTTLKKINCPRSCDPSNADCELKRCVITIEARDNGRPIPLTGRAFLTVILVDENDHDPVISFRYFGGSVATVEEGAEEGVTVVALVSVNDQDEGSYGQTNATIVAGNELGHFRLDPSSVDGLNIVVVNGRLDRERISKYNLTIEARDRGIPPRKSRAFLVILVNDINDHAPVFQNSSYTTELPEMVIEGSFVASITATDNDTGLNALITYDIVSGNDRGWFRIDQSTGLVTTALPLDREQQAAVVLRIRAQDGATSPQFSHTNLTITILDENDQTPHFSMDTFELSFIEGTSAGVALLTLTATDDDLGANGSVRYVLDPQVEHSYPGVFQLNRVTGRLTLLRDFDREEYDEFLLHVLAVDQGVPPLSSTTIVHITVQDINDNQPIFYPQQYFVTLEGTQANNSRLVQVKATDKDQGQNARITYRFQGTTNAFRIESQTGWIISSRQLQRGATPLPPSYSLTVSAWDGGNQTSLMSAQVEIVIVDSQDNIPQFSQEDGYDFVIVEDHDLDSSSIGRTVGEVSASITGESSVTYSIVDGNSDGVFTINRDTGLITTAQTVDREYQDYYRLDIIAVGDSSHTHTYVNISVTDVNDNVPMFGSAEVAAVVVENWPVGHDVLLCSAHDADEGDNGRVVYSLTSDSSPVFRVVRETGMIVLALPLSQVTEYSFTVHVIAQDSASNSRSSQQKAIISVEDVNDHTPTFEQNTYELSVGEDQTIHKRFFQVRALDEDIGLNSFVTYEIISGNKEAKFGIFPNGVLFIAHLLDREACDLYVLAIQATDHGDTPRFSATNVTIYVIDANDNDPSFSNSTYSFHMAENKPIGSSVGTLYASDRDKGQNAELSFHIEGNSFGFSVDPLTGMIASEQMFDREEVSRITGDETIHLNVIVEDNGEDRRTDSAKVVITIIDVNDNPPIFTQQVYYSTLYENMEIGSPLQTVRASDADKGTNAVLVYSIVSESGCFVIDPGTGLITVNKSLDRETKEKHEMSVLVMDEGEPPLSSTAIVVVTILDTNDNAPEFVLYQDEVRIMENIGVGRDVTEVRAVDRDLGSSSIVTYSITEGNVDITFHIDEHSGRITLAKSLDYETQQIYFLNISAADLGSPTLSSSILTRVHVLDFNDNAPQFTSSPVVAGVTEGEVAGTLVTAVTAVDADSHENGDVVYTLKKQDPARRHFSIDASTGRITTSEVLDHEFTESYRLTVVATDQAHPISARLSSEKLVTVFVGDINDNAPEFQSVSAVAVSQGTQVGNIICTVRAVDPDAGANGQVSYEIYSGDTQTFGINVDTGEVHLRTSLSNQVLTYDLTIRAEDNGQQRNQNFFSLTIFTTSNSDNGPVFTQTSYSGEVNENEPADTSIVTVSASYPSHTASIEYLLTGISSEGVPRPSYFQVHPASGLISTADVLDREDGPHVFEVEVFAVDKSASSPRTRSTQVQITLRDKNDSPPRFTSDLYELSVAEDSKPGHVVDTIVAEDDDVTGEITYSISNGADKKFDIDPSKGEITVIGDLDRETKPFYSLVVMADDGIQQSRITVTIEILDVNDEAPVFSEEVYSFSVAEDARTGWRLGQTTATDGDDGVNADLTYAIKSYWGRDKFSLNPHTGIINLIGNLDYEQNNHFVMTLKVQDSGVIPLTSTTTVYINVVDVNDNAPIFDPSTYSDLVWENTTVNSNILTVSATDVDSGVNGELRYSIAGGDPDGQFGIDAQSGVLYVASPLDRERQAHYNLVVEAIDLADDPRFRLTNTAVATVVLKDVNDHPPQFDTSSEITVMENTEIGASVHQISASDLDEGVNGEITYSLEASEGVFNINPTDGVLQINKVLDREIQDAYTLIVVASDLGTPALSSTMTFTVKVGDRNDNDPVFNPSLYEFTAPENIRIGTKLLDVFASDLDIGPNSEIRFIVEEGDSSQDFYLNSYSGEFTVQKRLDYERKKVYNIRIIAQDLGDPPRSDSATILVTVEDVNDCAPLFVDSPYLAYAQENVVNLPSHVTRLVARDFDSGAYGRVSYSILEGDRSLFNMNSSTGEISVLRMLDREQTSHYELKIVAFDTGSPRLTGTGTVTIIVGDVNDNAPVFHQNMYLAEVMENMVAPTPVTTVLASDIDSGKNADIRYILVRSSHGRFSIDEVTGLISTATSLDRETLAVHHLVVMATDSASLPFSVSVPVTVTVGDNNDNAPHFYQQAYTVKIRDPTLNSGFVVGVSALDRDEGRNGQNQYSLFGGAHADLFSIDSVTGVITAAEDLTASSEQQYSFYVRATDMGDNALSDEAQVTVSFLDAATTGFPVFTSTMRNAHISESAAVDARVATVSASSPRRATLTYHIVGGSTEAFYITSQGQIKVKAPLDYEVTPSYQLWIEARDGNLSDYYSLNVILSDENDNAPQFERLSYNASVAEEEFAFLHVATVQASDSDSGDNGLIEYDIAGGNLNSAFAIDSSSGVIQTQVKLDRETVSSYQLIITARDQGLNPHTATAMVAVTVLDKNDCPPIFSQHFNIRIPENAPVGSFVLRITSTDNDEGINARHTYTLIKNPGSKFTIDQNSGNITVAKPLDRESIDEYILEVAANDGAYNAETSVSIDVLDVNDNQPRFDDNSYDFSLVEGSGVGTLIGRVSASDLDANGPNAELYYRLKKPTSFFSIDATSGVITSRRVMEYKFAGKIPSPENTQHVTVVVSDQGEPPLSSDVPIIIHLLPANVHTPVFEQQNYTAAVVTNSPVNSTVLQLHARDEDFGVNGDLMYEVLTGNGSQVFSINEQTGVIWLVLPVINQVGLQYKMIVRASDSGLPQRYSDANVYIYVSEINFNPPRFTQGPSELQTSIPESHSVGSPIAQVTATDDDAGPNGMVTYEITDGDPKGLFFIDPTRGNIKTLASLDYEVQRVFLLTITASDSGAVPRTASIVYKVTITDVNDNAPRFLFDSYDISVRENAPVDSLVYQLVASDADTSPYDIIRYRMVSSQSVFSLDAVSGFITSTTRLDFETVPEYTLSVEAYNPGTSLSTSVTLNIHIQGENEYIPRFANAEYSFSISESESIGFPIGEVSATDQDDGIDGKVFYYFIGDSNMKGFSLEPETGVISIADVIDREATSEITLDVLSKNQGPILGNDTDTCQVRVIIRDANDPPRFTRSLFEGSVREDAHLGFPILQVHAVDNDLQTQFRTFYYSIAGGNVDDAFEVNRTTGWISTTADLDREKIGIYNLTLAAIDTGSPPKTGTVLVKVYLDDVNDNAPHFVPTVPEGQVLENQNPYSSVIIDLTQYTQDRDLPPNKGPYQYSIQSHTHIFDIGMKTGIVKAKQILDREAKSSYNVKVRVEDKGESVMTSNLTFNVKVQDVNDNPPTPRVLQVEAFAYQGRFIGGILADVRPSDPDIEGNYTCALVRSDATAFSIPRGCELHASQLQDMGSYEVSVEGSDGVHSRVSYVSSVELVRFDSDTITNSLVLKLANTTAEDFVGQAYTTFVEAVQESLDASASERLVLYAVNSDTPNINVFVAVTIRETTYLSKSLLREKITAIKGEIQRRTGLFILSIDLNSCDESPCQNEGLCSSHVQILPDQRNIVNSDSRILTTAPKVSLEVVCVCEQGFTGRYCEKHVDACKSQPCLNKGICTHNGPGAYHCQCTEAFTGNRCQEDVNECLETSPCLNGGTCENTEGSYNCLCTANFIGDNCETDKNNCGNLGPCLNGGTCQDGICICRYGDRGSQCEVTSRSFEALSFMEYNISLIQMNKRLELEFATLSSTALLLFTYGHSPRTDFMALELINGQVRFSFSAGDEVSARVTVPVTVNDGEWYRVEANRIARQGTVRVSRCIRGQTTCSRCQDGDSSCYRRIQQNSQSDLLDNDSQRVFLIGGLRSTADIASYLPTISTHDFTGCMRALKLNSIDVWSTLQPARQTGVSGSCSRQTGGVDGGCPSCVNGGVCVDAWTKASCRCPAKYVGDTCNKHVESYSLGSNSVVTFTQKETYIRDQLATSQLTDRLKRDTHSDIKHLLIELRTVNDNGLIFLGRAPLTMSAFYIKGGLLHYHAQASGGTINFKLSQTSINDGLWHNISLLLSDDNLQVTLTMDDLSQRKASTFAMPSLVSLDTQVFYLGGTSSPITLNGSLVPGFEGCVKQVELGNGDLALAGETDRFTIETSGNVNASCDPSFHAPRASSTDDESLPVHVAVIAVVAVFGVAILAMLLVFLLLRMRRRQQEKQKANKPDGRANGGLHKDATGCAPTGPQLSEEQIISQHLQDELTASTTMYHQRMSPHAVGSRPDLVAADTGNSRELSAGSGDGVENAGYNDDPPEHYDIDNASSIAPSDLVDVVSHYKNYRRGMLGHNSKPKHAVHRNGVTLCPSTMLAPTRESPGLHITRHSPASLTNQRNSPGLLPYGSQNLQLRQSPHPHTVNNLNLPGPSRSMTKSPLANINMRDGVTPVPQSMRSTPLSGINGLYSPSNASSTPSSYEYPLSSAHVPSRPGSHLRQPISTLGIRSTPTVGLTVEEVNRLNARHKSSPISTVDVQSSSSSSSSSQQQVNNKINTTDFTHADLLDPVSRIQPESSSEDDTADDSFTCSEYEFDNDKNRQDFNNPHRLVPLPARGGHESSDAHQKYSSHDAASDSTRGDQDSFSTFFTSDDDLPSGRLPTSALNWDYLLNWGPNFEKLVGVFNDIAQLPDASGGGGVQVSENGHVGQEGGGKSPRPPSAQRISPLPKSLSPKPLPQKMNTHRSFATPSPLHVIEEDRPFQENGVDSSSLANGITNPKEEYV